MTPNEFPGTIEANRFDYIEQQRQLFEQAKPALLAQYLDQYVAFENNQVLDHDVDRQRLAQRVYAKYGYRDLLMRKVTVNERVYAIGGFRTTGQADS